MPESRVVRGTVGETSWIAGHDRLVIATGGDLLVDCFNNNKPIAQIPVLVLPLDASEQFSEEIVERVTRANLAFYDEQFPAHKITDEEKQNEWPLHLAATRAALNALLPPK